jgi:hypothetical protein
VPHIQLICLLSLCHDFALHPGDKTATYTYVAAEETATYTYVFLRLHLDQPKTKKKLNSMV